MRTALNRFLPLAAFVLVVLVNYVANALPLNGQSQAEISARYPSLFTPAGFTFSIWGLLYLLQFGYALYQALPAQANDRRLTRVSWLFTAACLTNAGWVVVWHYELLWTSMLLILGILVCLIALYRALDELRPGASIPARLLLLLPLSMYLSWVCLATIANISVIQTANEWNDVGLAAVDWTLLKLALAGALGATMVLRRGDIGFVLVVAWAAFGISSKQVATPAVSGAAILVTYVALMLAALQAARMLFTPNPSPDR